MRATTTQYEGSVLSFDPASISAPSAFVEYGFYFYMFYTLLGGVLGLFINNLASGVLVLLVILCLSEVGYNAFTVIRLVAFPLGCALTFTFVQLWVFEESLTEAVRPFLIWMLLVFLSQMLALRANFLHHFVLVMCLIGLGALPYLSFYQAGEAMQRARIDKAIGFGHTNAMGEWYGFCAVYLILLGFTLRTNATRLLSWVSAVACLYVVTLTVSRGALVAVAISIVMASRKLLKRGFLPLLLLMIVLWVVVELGVFEETFKLYTARGTEDSGRLAVWPLIIDSFLGSPLVGVGHGHIGAITSYGIFYTPHNGFLYIAQSSGIFPLILFIAYWVRVGWVALKVDKDLVSDGIFYLPFLVFSFITTSLGNFGFMELPVIASLAFPLATGTKRQFVDARVRGSTDSILNRGM
jgi:O-antigen ligase